jgi:hypothetical protein
MSTLRTIEREPFEDLLGMSGGYVLDFTNQTFAAFLRETADVDIYADKYARYGDSKAKRLRAFWETESDPLVAKVLSGLVEFWAYKNPAPGQEDAPRLQRCRAAISRLLGQPVAPKDPEKDFLERDFGKLSIASTNLDGSLIAVLEERLSEALRCLDAKAPLATIFLSGSILEGLLLGVACGNPREFNQAASSPKSTAGTVKPFHEWSLAQLIDVAFELGHLKLDVKKFGHALRDFRNYIHPYQQLSSRFSADHHTARICLQVLRAAVASVSGQRST